MCHQWFSIVGLTLDIIGFLMIAFELHIMFKREMLEHQNQIATDFERSAAELDGLRTYDDPSEGDHTMWREFQKLLRADKRFRRRLFFPGVWLVILGFIFQVFGSWPYGLAALGFSAC